MNTPFLDFPKREKKPRQRGLTLLIDPGVPFGMFQDVIRNSRDYVDFVKFGWCTSLVSHEINAKIEFLRGNEVDFFFGGTLFEKALHQNKLEPFKDYLESYDCEYVEISNGTLDLSNPEKCKYIAQFSREFKVLSEVGFKDSQKSLQLHPAHWIKFIRQDHEAGAWKVITEARESGTSGICREDGEVRFGLIEEILDSDFDMDDLVFEAPNKDLQTYFVKRLGANVNLGNIPFSDVVGLETLRLGIRSDTFFSNGEGAP